jgi:hypothetical protein
MPPQAWAWENRHGLLVTARRIWMDQSDSPETARASEVGSDLNLSTSSWTEDREDDCSGRESPPTAKTATAPAAAVPGQEAPRETSPTAEELWRRGWSRRSGHHHHLPLGLTINVPVVYMVRYKVVLRGDYP